MINITTPRLKIRELNSKDLFDFHYYRSNPEVVKYQGFDVMNLAEAGEFISMNSKSNLDVSGTWVQFGIEKLETSKLIGDCAIKLERKETVEAEIGLTISHLEQQKGFGSEALKEIVQYLFTARCVNKIVEHVDVENVASVNLLKKLGFVLNEVETKSVLFKGDWVVEAQYVLLGCSGEVE